MTIRPGHEWGRPVTRPTDLVVCRSDAEYALRSVDASSSLAVGAGDLYRCVGGASDRTEMQLVEIDMINVLLDETHEHRAVAHVVIRNRWWRSGVVMAMNVDHLGEWNVAPRAHPNDGRFDVCEIMPEMPIRQRWQARRRVVSGTHVPHPHISVATAKERHWSFDRPVGVWVDGIRVGRARSIRLTVQPDAAHLHI